MVDFLNNFPEITLSMLSKKDKLLFLSYLHYHIYEELVEYFNYYTETNFQLKTLHLSTEDSMPEVSILIYVIRDILSTDNYSLTGLANYTRIPEDVIYDLLAGLNKNPSLFAWKQIIALHTTVKRGFYYALIKKILSGLDTK